MADLIRDRMKRDLLSTWIKKGFEDEDDLYFYIQFHDRSFVQIIMLHGNLFEMYFLI
jgi:hypothetical protein